MRLLVRWHSYGYSAGMKNMSFAEALKELIRQGNTEVIATEKARKLCFKAGLSREVDLITKRLRAILSSRLGVRIV